VSTDDDNTAAMITDLATATNLIHAVARDTRSTAPELEAADLYTLGAVLDELTSTLAHIADQCAAATGNYPDGRILRDDSDTHDPAARGAEAADHLHQTSRHLNAANEDARRSTPPSATWAPRCSDDLSKQCGRGDGCRYGPLRRRHRVVSASTPNGAHLRDRSFGCENRRQYPSSPRNSTADSPRSRVFAAQARRDRHGVLTRGTIAVR